MIFNEIYGAYYAAVAEILKRAVSGTLDEKTMIAVIQDKAFVESVPEIQRPLENGRWQLLLRGGSTPVRHEPSMPLTLLEKRWLKAISLDKRVKLFNVNINLPDVEPLFRNDDIEVFDRYGDGDPFENEEYIHNFQIILQALKERHALQIDIPDRSGQLMRVRAVPDHLEYSEKDDKFRLYMVGASAKAVNLAKIISVKRYYGRNLRTYKEQRNEECAEIEITDKRNSLERCLFHFAHFKKEVEKIGEDKYLARIYYDKSDESEMVIRILSFGPLIIAVGNDRLVNLIKERLLKQKKLWTK